MDQLSGLDASFLAMESSLSPMHVGSVIFYKPAKRGYPFSDFEALMSSVADTIPVLTQRLLKVPMDLGRPFWSDDPAFDIDNHIQEVRLPGAAGKEELRSFVQHYFAQALDPERPLWSMAYVSLRKQYDGLPPGCFAIVTKLHHCAVDGSKANNMLAALQAEKPSKPVKTVKGKSRKLPIKAIEKPIPAGRELLSTSLANSLINPKNGWQQIKHFSRTSRHALKELPKIDFLPPLPFSVPSTRFNKTITGARSYDGIFFSLTDTLALRKVVEGVTVNDVMMSIIAGALRLYLQSLSELPKKSLVALVPVSLRGEGNDTANMGSIILVNLETNEPDALERLRKIHTHSNNGKKLTQAIGPSGMMDMASLSPFAISNSLSKLASVMRAANYMKPLFNLVISNVPGARGSLYMGDSTVVKQLSMTPIADGIGLAFTVNSYGENMSIGVNSCAEMIPDMQMMMGCLQESLDDHFKELARPAKRKKRASNE